MSRTRKTLALLLLAATPAAHAGSIPLRWDPAPGASGYRLEFGREPGVYDGAMTVMHRTQAVLQGLDDCTSWFVSVRSLNAVGPSTGSSNELSGWPSPRIDALSPGDAEQDGFTTIDLSGANFAPGIELRLEADPIPVDADGEPLIRLDSFQRVSCSELRVVLAVAALDRGLRAMPVGGFALRLVATNPDLTFVSRPASIDIRFDPARRDINRIDPSNVDRIDGGDLSWLAYAYGATEGDPHYLADADLNGDGVVDGIDLAYLASGFGTCRSGEEWTVAACG